jgi:4-azaleucine resistance transporter AzlC
VGTVLPFEFKGVEFVLTALFVAIFTDQWLSTKDHVPSLIGVISTAACLFIFGNENFLIPAMITITLALTVLRHVRKEDKKDDK